MVSNRKGEWQARFDTQRKLSRALVDQPSKVTISSGKFALADGAALFGALA